MKRSLLSLLVLPIALAACADRAGDSIGENSRYNSTVLPTQQQSDQNNWIVYRATEALISRAKQYLDESSPILVTSLVNIDNLNQSSTFGRLIGDQTSNRLVQLGLVVRDVRLSNSLRVKEGTGELILSRDLKRIGKTYNAQAVVAGTYAIGGEQVYVNLRLLSPTSGRILSAIDYVLPLDRDTRGLIFASRQGQPEN